MIEQGAMLGTGDAQTASDVAIHTSQGHPGNVPMPPMQDKFSHSAESSRELRDGAACWRDERRKSTSLPPPPPPPRPPLSLLLIPGPFSISLRLSPFPLESAIEGEACG